MTVFVDPKGGQSSFKEPEVGDHLGLLYRIIDLGTHHNQKYDTHSRKVFLGWELPDQVYESEENGVKVSRPMVTGQYYTLSYNEKANFRKIVETGLRRALTRDELVSGIDLKTIIGQPFTISLQQNESGKVKVAAVGGVVERMRSNLPALVNKPQLFSLFDPDRSVFDSLPEGLQKMIKESPEYSKVSAQRAAQNLKQSGATSSVPRSVDAPPPASESDYGSDIDDEIPW